MKVEKDTLGNNLTAHERTPRSDTNDTVRLTAWRKKRALSGCYNLIYHIKSSPRRRRYIEPKQCEVDEFST